VAEGATVQDKTLYDVRILGGNSSITSELQLKKPLDPSTAGFYRCEAWPHGGGGGPSYGQNTAQDVYVIGMNFSTSHHLSKKLFELKPL